MRTLIIGLLVPAVLGAQEARPVEHLEAAEAELRAAMEVARIGLAEMPFRLEALEARLSGELEGALMETALMDAKLAPGLARLEAGLAGLAASGYALGEGIVVPGWRTRRLPPSPRADQQDPADSLYRAAREAMTRGNHRDAARMFARIADQHRESSYAADALYWEAFNLYREGGERNLDRALRSLERQRALYEAARTRRNGEAEQLATRIRGQLARLGDPDAAAAIAEGAQDPCDTPEQEMRMAALNALMHMDADQALPILKSVLERRDACSAEMRRKATFLLSQHETPETVDILLEVAENDPDLEVRKQAVFWLSEVEDERAVEALEGVLRTATDEELAKRAAFALAQHESGRASAALRQAAANDQFSVELRKRVIFWLGQADEGSRENVEFLQNLFGRLTDEELKERVLFAVAESDVAGAGAWLLDVALDEQEDMETRKRALFWAGESGAPIEQLVELYDRMDDREIKERLLYTYSQRDEDAALGKLIDIARTEPDVELRKRAIFWLGQSDDPRAAEALMEIISG